MNNLRLKCGPARRTGTQRLRGSDGGDGVPGWCSSPLSDAFEIKAKARFAWKFGFGANAVLLAILMVISSIVAPVDAELFVNRETEDANAIDVNDPTVSAVTYLKDLTIQSSPDGDSGSELIAGDCFVVRFSPVEEYAAETYGPNKEPGPFNEELTQCVANVAVTCKKIDAYEFHVTLGANTVPDPDGSNTRDYSLVLQEVGPF